MSSTVIMDQALYRDLLALSIQGQDRSLSWGVAVQRANGSLEELIKELPREEGTWKVMAEVLEELEAKYLTAQVN